MHCERLHGVTPFQSPGAHTLMWYPLLSHFPSAQEEMETLWQTIVKCLLLPNPFSSTPYPPSNKDTFLLLQRKSQHQLYLQWRKGISTWIGDLTFQWLVSYCHSLNNLARQSQQFKEDAVFCKSDKWTVKTIFLSFLFPNQEEDH